MARNKGTFNFAANFQVKMQELLDPRGGVDTKSELINKETFPYDGDTIYMKEGMLVTVKEERSVYMLVDINKILSTDYSGWERKDAGAVQQVEVVDGLNSEDSAKALSANQGRLLKELIDEVSQKVASIYTPKGSVAFEGLPVDGANIEPGWVFNITNDFELNGKAYSAGTNIVWTDEGWDPLSASIDLSNYYNKGEVDSEVEKEKNRAAAAEKTLQDNIDALEDAALILTREDQTVTQPLTVHSLKSFNFFGAGASLEDSERIVLPVITYEALKVDNGNAQGVIENLLKYITGRFNGALAKSNAYFYVPLSGEDVSFTSVASGYVEVLIADTSDVTDSSLPKFARGVYHVGAVTGLNTVEGGAELSFGVQNGVLWMGGTFVGTASDAASLGGVAANRYALKSDLNAITNKDTEQDDRLTVLENLVTGGESGEGGQTLLEMVSANTAAIEALQTSIGTLNSDAETEGSVDYKIKQAFAWVYVE